MRLETIRALAIGQSTLRATYAAGRREERFAAVGAGFYFLFICECGQQKKQKRTKTKNEK